MNSLLTIVLTGHGLELLALFAVLVLVIYTVARINRPRARIGDRAREVVGKAVGPIEGVEAQAEPPSVGAQLAHLLSALGDKLPLFNHKQRQQIVTTLLSAGIRHTHAVQLFISAKLLSGVLVTALAPQAFRFLPPDSGALAHILVLAAGLQVGLMAPEILLHAIVRRRQKAIHRSLPDAMDLLVICTNAGYSLPAAIHRVAIEMRNLSRPLANELDLTAHDIQLSADPATALRKLSDRCKVPSLRGLVTTLVQAQQCGTPITQSLKTLAKTERATRILLLEEKGAKLAAKLTLPMMLLILPAVLLISGAPAMMQLTGSLR